MLFKLQRLKAIRTLIPTSRQWRHRACQDSENLFLIIFSLWILKKELRVL